MPLSCGNMIKNRNAPNLLTKSGSAVPVFCTFIGIGLTTFINKILSCICDLDIFCLVDEHRHVVFPRCGSELDVH
jgi:hypothetical protein